MTEDDFKKLMTKAKTNQEAYEKRLAARILRLRFKIMAEGLAVENEPFNISEGLRLERATFDERVKFFDRAKEFEGSESKAKKNEFFLVYERQATGAELQGSIGGNSINVISIFFTVCSNKFLEINKGQNYVLDEGKEISLGLSFTPFRSIHFQRGVTLDQSDVDQLKELWPLFIGEYHQNHSFALVARRYYYSLHRLDWEDQLLDLMIALEAFFMPEEGQKNIRGKIAKRLSRFLKGTFDRNAVASQVKRAYKLRNEVVHGQRNEELDTHILVADVSSYLKAALQLYLKKYPGIPIGVFAEALDRERL